MRLNEAMRLGIMAYKFDAYEYVTDGAGCALGVAFMAATGITNISDNLDDDRIRMMWPWLNLHPRWKWSRDYFLRIEHMAFDVDDGKMKFGELCHQVKQWEDKLAAKGINVEQVTMIATPEATHEPAAEHTGKVYL